jgi:hypothetical protein
MPPLKLAGKAMKLNIGMNIIEMHMPQKPSLAVTLRGSM